MSVLTIDEVYPKGTLSFSSLGYSNSKSFINEFLKLTNSKQKDSFRLISSDNNLIPFLTVTDYLSLGTNKLSKYVKQDLIDILPEFKLAEKIVDTKIINLSEEETFFIQLISALFTKQDYLIIDDITYNKAIGELNIYYDLLNSLAKKYNIAITIISSRH